MSGGELLLTGFVALIVFGPSKLPGFLKHIGFVLSKLNALKERAHLLWQVEMKKEALLENEKKALVADKEYQGN